ncbi:MAG: cell division protein SepF [bacterium]
MALNIKKLFKEEDDEINVKKGTDDEFYNLKDSPASVSTDSNGNMMIIHEPRAFSEAQQIVEHLKNRNSVVVNLKRVKSEQALRIIDFLSGCIYSINGSMKKLDVGIYICAPNNVSVQGKISEEREVAKNTKSKTTSSSTSTSGNSDLDW